MTRLGTIRLRIARARGRNFLLAGRKNFRRRAEDVAMRIREAFLGGILTRRVGRIVASFTGEPVSAYSVSRLSRNLDAAVRKLHPIPQKIESSYVFLDGASPRVRRLAARERDCDQLRAAARAIRSQPGPDPLFDLSQPQCGMAQPHRRGFYTGRLTSPSSLLKCAPEFP